MGRDNLRVLARLALVALTSVLSGAALAADVIPPVQPGTIVVPAAPVDAGFDWSRFHAGVQAGAWFETDPAAFHSVRGAAMLGRNVVLGQRVLVGAEAIGGFYVNAADGLLFDAMAMGRAGLMLTDRVLAYGTVGFGYDFDTVTGGAFMVAGGGVEVGVAANLGVRSEVVAFRYFGAPFNFVSGTVGVSWYFGR